MAGIPGDATKEEADKLTDKEIRSLVTNCPEGGTVTLSSAHAQRLLEMLGPAPEEDDEEDEVAPRKVAAAAAPAKYTRAQLNEMTKEELLEVADDLDVDAAQSWSKADIIDAIVKHK